MHHYIHQLDSKACGPTSLKIYLSLVLKDERYLTVEEDWTQPSSFLDLIEASRHLGVPLIGYRLHSLSYLKRIHKPFILYQTNPNPHYVVIQPLGFGRWRRYDPATGIDMITHRAFDSFPIKILIHDSDQGIKPTSFQSFQTPPFPFLFFLMSSLFLTTLLLTYFFFPSFRLMHEMFLLLFILSFLWIAYVLTLLKHYHQWMDDQHAKKIKTMALFKQFHYIKTMHVQLPLKKLYTIFSLSAISLYFFLQPIVLLPSLWVSACLLVLIKYPIEKRLRSLGTNVERFESTLRFPLQDAKELHQLNHWGHHYFYLQMVLLIIHLVGGILSIYLSSATTPINGTQWLLSMSLFLTFYRLIDQLRSIPQTKTTLLTMMNAFINSRDVIK